jgi:ribose transport system substrate-binding protein
MFDMFKVWQAAAPKMQMQRSLHKLGLLVSAGLICTAAHAADDSLTNRQGDITPLCGTKPMIVGVSDGYGGNTWRKTGLAEVKDELSRCKNVKRVIYSNANGDPPRNTTLPFLRVVPSQSAQRTPICLVSPVTLTT